MASADRLKLESLSVDHHLDGFHKMVTDEKSMSWSSKGLSQGLEDSKARMLTQMPSPTTPWLEPYAIVLTDLTATMIGTIGTSFISPGGAPEVAYGLHSDYWGCGYASEAVDLFAKLQWDKAGEGSIDAIVAHTDIGNLASERVLIKAGFKRLGVWKEYYSAENIKTGAKELRDVTCWSLQRPKG